MTGTQKSPNGSVITVFVGGTVRVDENTIAQAIAVRDGRVIFVGDHDTVLHQYPDAEKINMHGLVASAGLIDTHPHMLHFAMFGAPLVDVREAKSWDDIISAVRGRASSTPSGHWIMTTPVGDDGSHYFVKRSWRNLSEGVLPDAAALDTATLDHPVLIQAWAPRLPNVAVLNTAAIKLLGLDSSPPDSDGFVTLERNEAQQLTGRIMGSVNSFYNLHNDAWAKLWAQIPIIQPDLLPMALKVAMKQKNLKGITAVYEGHAMNRAQIGLYTMFNDAEALSVRVMAAPDVLGTFESNQTPNEAQLIKDIDVAVSLQGNFGDMFRVNGFCLAPTGPGYNGHMVMKTPYKAPFGGMTSGLWAIPVDLVEKAMYLGKQHGLRVNLACGGLGEHDHFLKSLDKMRDEGVIDGSERWLLQHTFFLGQSHAQRYAAHGFQATICPGFTYGKGDMYAERMGEDVLQHLCAFRRMIDAGIDVAGSSDWGPSNPFKQMELAITHEMGQEGKHNNGPAQVVTQKEAYAMWCRQAAKVLGWTSIGDLHPGSHADLILLDRDPVTCPIADLGATRVEATFLSGKLVSGTVPESK